MEVSQSPLQKHMSHALKYFPSGLTFWCLYHLTTVPNWRWASHVLVWGTGKIPVTAPLFTSLHVSNIKVTCVCFAALMECSYISLVYKAVWHIILMYGIVLLLITDRKHLTESSLQEEGFISGLRFLEYSPLQLRRRRKSGLDCSSHSVSAFGGQETENSGISRVRYKF